VLVAATLDIYKELMVIFITTILSGFWREFTSEEK